jgi:endonuclease III
MAHKLAIRKTRRLRPILARLYKEPEPPDPKDTMLDRVVMAVLWVDAAPLKARQAYVKLSEAFVDWNELRVSITSEAGSVLVACGLSPVKAAALKRILGRAVEELYSFDFELLATRSRQALKAWFTSIEGMPHPIAAAVLYHVFHYDRVLVDAEMARVIRRLGLADETESEAQIEEGLSQVIPAREAYLVYSGLRQHALTVCTKDNFDCRACLLRKECATGPVHIAELDAAALDAKKKAKARARKSARAAAKPSKAASKRPAKRGKR